ncbi:sensor domain-containing diguanylate cyclase [Aliidiomarina quisquiliarum]|uniref:sensor domain-containing diguanylate cyclase n=1 Tax=Aliidiomarina quisquiliarum TaxID=2938947 RepID=UPI00208E9AA8|nr:sensor domain-containing diguanylate cyclase [Aliidiomarina quisquiliarum]MCO4322012.1 sensor domain-containing diguanylate cyclase [Aliidiomarina quisquiliarum]
MSNSAPETNLHIAELALSLLKQMSVGVIAQLPRSATHKSTLYANHAAQRLLRLSNSCPTTAELDALPFIIDTELVATPTPKYPTQPPITRALSFPGIERRDLTLYGRAVSIEGQYIHCNDHGFPVVLIFERDHRLFVQQRHTSDLLTSEVSLKDMIAFDKLISQLSTALINVPLKDAKAHIQNALAALGEFCQADRTYIFEFNNSLGEMSNTYEWVREGVTSHIDDLQALPQSSAPWFTKLLEQEGLFIVNDVRDIPPEGKAEQDEFNSENICSVLCVGMYIQQKLVGMVGCDMVARRRHWTEADVRRLKIVGEILTNALQKQYYIHSLHAAHKELVEANTALQQLAQRDGLTGIANRRHFDEVIDAELARAQRHKTPLVLVLFDIDYFKHYNDHYGHLAGDKVLQRVATKLQKQFKRSGELVARFGGEEFAVILPNISLAVAQQQVERLLNKLVAADIEHIHSPHCRKLTMSAGISSFNPERSCSVNSLINNADLALYEAKESGRNCTRTKNS